MAWRKRVFDRYIARRREVAYRRGRFSPTDVAVAFSLSRRTLSKLIAEKLIPFEAVVGAKIGCTESAKRWKTGWK